MTNNNQIQTFGNYILLKKLAEGGMAEVFLARPASRDGNGRVIVVKRILPHIASHSMFVNMFQREIQIIMGFNHAHAVQLHDSGSVNGQLYIAMEYIEGKSLKDILEKLRTKNHLMPIPMVLSLMAQAASGLYYAHTFVNKITGEELNAVHRDISPHNLLVSYEGNLKVIDFGIAKAACSVQDLTQTGMVKGKAAYFAPEQLSGQKLDGRTDIFALGAVMWELLTGERLFAKPGDSEITAMQRVSNCDKHVVPPSSKNKDVPPEVDQIVMMALEKDPNERFPNARDMQAALRGVLSRHYPAYTYADTGKLMNVIFADEIESERTQLRDLNIKAQLALVGNPDDKTTTMAATTANATAIKKGPPMGAVSSYQEPMDQTQEGLMNFRLSKIEQALKQKATGRHWAMFAFYVVSLVALKLSEHYNFDVSITAADAKVTEATSKSASNSVAVATPALPAVETVVQQMQSDEMPKQQIRYKYVPRNPAAQKVSKAKPKKQQQRTKRR